MENNENTTMPGPEEQLPPDPESRPVRILKSCLAWVAVCGAVVIVMGVTSIASCGGSRGATHSEKIEKVTRLAEIDRVMKGE
jgi:hypothetical protein